MWKWYQARRFGVRSAMASITTKRKCPDLIFVRRLQGGEEQKGV
jgi:nucleotidyltransferase/DNA polymerase involved in DNA repair